MGSLSEIRVNWRYLAAASAGMGSGILMTQYVTNIFAPHLIAEFGWSKSEFALIGMVTLISILTLPPVGRMADIFGVRRTAAIGILATPLIFVAYSLFDGSFLLFFLLNLLHVALVGATTSSAVYSRLVAQSFQKARGVALALSACFPPALGAIAASFLSGFIDDNGWRTGYLVMAGVTIIGGIITLTLIPAHSKPGPTVDQPQKRTVRHDYGRILRNPAFALIIIGVLLCNLTLVVQSSQLKLILLDIGMTSGDATRMVAFYGGGIVFGRLMCGFALDRLPSHWVAATCMAFIGLGLGILATGNAPSWLILFAVMSIGLSMGAEADINGYLMARFFPIDIFSSAYSLVSISFAISAALGALILSLLLKLGGGFSLFLAITSLATFMGTIFFVMLGRCTPVSLASDEVEKAGGEPLAN